MSDTPIYDQLRREWMAARFLVHTKQMTDALREVGYAIDGLRLRMDCVTRHPIAELPRRGEP